ncbi:hypothetical protein EJ06DRAFT_531924 [Trichodelitschia bisporula]|uniref:Uncharacterized protein n=1 Tax=Trichodelitschia bisporula TaxID=703511 RepID=A0A6G1HS19_9PEZI|nr:hypothetical protein EJ06DRAFT_531924 [Trichodelitschia bisporula]
MFISRNAPTAERHTDAAAHYHQTDPHDPYRHEYPACMQLGARFLTRPPPNLATEIVLD